VSVAGKTAIVTGAATGIGAATATLLAERGARVLAAGLQPDALRATVEAIVAGGGEAIAVDADVSDPAEIEALAAAAER
jgi:NAD(P)-dependent dehydrogenase (short-subunit alcohol dehydrogenase family)